jgi:hypothetical protein
MSFGDPLKNHPKPHGKPAPVAPVQDFRSAQAAIEARRAQMNDAATAERVARGAGTLKETIAVLEKATQQKAAATSHKTR